MDRMRQFLSAVSKYTSFINFLVSIALLAERHLGMNLPTGFFVGTACLAGVAGLIDKSAKDLAAMETVNRALTGVLVGLMRCVSTELNIRSRLRVNLYLPGRDGRLHSRFHLNMTGSPDIGLSWGENQGCIGLCYATGRPVAEDVSRFRGMSFEDVSAIKDDSPVRWGLTRDQWLRTSGLGCILCIPIPHPERPWQAVGVVSVDSTDPLGDTNFRSEAVIRPLSHQYAPILSEVIYRFGLASE